MEPEQLPEHTEVAVSADGMRVGHLHDGELRLCDVLSRRVRTIATCVDDYAMSSTGERIVWLGGGRLHYADTSTRHAPAVDTAAEQQHASVSLATAGPVQSARPDPTGRRIAYLTDGTLRVVTLPGTTQNGTAQNGTARHGTGPPPDTLLAGESGGVRWGDVDPHGPHFGRNDGWWWAPDGESILATRRQGLQISLHLLDLDGGWVDVHWDREIYPYLGSVCWADGGPLITVMRRSQAHGLVLAVDRRTGETQVHAELVDPRWVNPVPGTPRHLVDGRVLVGGEIVHDGYDARCLFADGTLLTPPGLYVRRVVGRLGPGASGGELGDLLVEASEGEPAEQHLFRVRGAVGSGMVVHRLSSRTGWHTARCGGDTVVTGFRSLDHEGVQWTVWHADALVVELTGRVPVPAGTPRPLMDRVTDRRLPIALVYPPGHVFGRRLPVLLLLPETPTAQQVRQDHDAFRAAFDWAAAGYAVVLVDGRGSIGVTPSYEKVTHRRLADLAVADQVDALHAVADKHADLDLSRVTAVGRDFGGWLATLLTDRRPDAVQAALAVTPWDWATLPVPLAERYLGPHEADSEVYARHEVGPANEKRVQVLSHLDPLRALTRLREPFS